MAAKICGGGFRAVRGLTRALTGRTRTETEIAAAPEVDSGLAHEPKKLSSSENDFLDVLAGRPSGAEDSTGILSSLGVILAIEHHDGAESESDDSDSSCGDSVCASDESASRAWFGRTATTPCLPHPCTFMKSEGLSCCQGTFAAPRVLQDPSALADVRQNCQVLDAGGGDIPLDGFPEASWDSSSEDSLASMSPAKRTNAQHDLPDPREYLTEHELGRLRWELGGDADDESDSESDGELGLQTSPPTRCARGVFEPLGEEVVKAVQEYDCRSLPAYYFDGDEEDSDDDYVQNSPPTRCHCTVFRPLPEYFDASELSALRRMLKEGR